MESAGIVEVDTGERPEPTEPRMGRMDQIITGLVNATVVPMSNVVVFLATSGLLLVIFAALWLGVGAALIWNQGGLDAAWQSIQALPLVVQAVAWLLFLPVMAGIWIWETTWPLIVRIVLIGGLAAWNLLVFVPQASPKP